MFLCLLINPREESQMCLIVSHLWRSDAENVRKKKKNNAVIIPEACFSVD